MLCSITKPVLPVKNLQNYVILDIGKFYVNNIALRWIIKQHNTEKYIVYTHNLPDFSEAPYSCTKICSVYSSPF